MEANLERNWKRWFDERSLFRGMDYFENGLVRMDEEGGAWKGYADGAERYFILIGRDGRGSLSPGASDSYCTCPHARDGHYCKHLAAACYEIERKNSLSGQHAVSKASAVSKDGFSAGAECGIAETLASILDSLGEDDMRAFLGEVVNADERWGRALRNRFGTPDIRRVCRELEIDFQTAVYSYSYNGFVEWRHALPFELDIVSAIGHAAGPFLNRGFIGGALAVSRKALEEIRYIQVDDSDGFFDAAIEACFSIWTDALEQYDDAETKDALFECAQALLEEEETSGEEADVLYYEQTRAEDWLIEHLASDPHSAEAMLDLIRENVSDPPDGKTFYGYDHNSNTKWVIAGMRSMEALGKPRDERMAFAMPYVSDRQVLQALVDDALSDSDREGARRLLLDAEQSLENELASANGPDSWRSAALLRNLRPVSAQLLDMLEEDGNQVAVANQLRKLLTIDDQPAGAVEHLDRLCELVDDAQWQDEREVVLANVLTGGIRRELLAHEGLVDRLMQDIEASGSAYDLMSYESVLKDAYAPQILAAYRKKLEDDLNRASARNAYQSGVAILSRFGNIKGGVKAREAACEWIRQTFPRRPALQDELRKRERTWM